jgi:hypothetical protein
MSREGEVSVVTDTLDSLVQAASVPNLASLFKRGKDAGLITPITGYGEGVGSSSTTSQQPPF